MSVVFSYRFLNKTTNKENTPNKFLFYSKHYGAIQMLCLHAGLWWASVTAFVIMASLSSDQFGDNGNRTYLNNYKFGIP